ncbi:MAG: D-alanyl-D-alanine carboxypeptidase family protein [Hyphomonadaceae bacterium]
MTHSGAFTVRSFAIAGAALFAANALPDDAFAQDRYAAIVIDVATNEVLHQDAADERRFPASLTKMMTLYMLFEALERGDISLEDRLVASRHAARQPPSRLGVRRGDVLTVEQAIGALVVQSANDVAAMVAERLGGTESNFAVQMTARARQLGMTSTRFMNASGLPNPEIRTTARDMATLSIAIWRDFPQYYHYFQMPTNSWRGREGRNHNRLLGQVEGVDGIKTGYTRASGFNLATATVRNGRRVITVVLGGETAAARDAQVAYLIEGAYEELARRQELDPANVNFVSRNVQNVNATLMRAGRPVGPLQGPLDPTALLPVEQGDAALDTEDAGDAAAPQAQ